MKKTISILTMILLIIPLTFNMVKADTFNIESITSGNVELIETLSIEIGVKDYNGYPFSYKLLGSNSDKIAFYNKNNGKIIKFDMSSYHILNDNIILKVDYLQIEVKPDSIEFSYSLNGLNTVLGNREIFGISLLDKDIKLLNFYKGSDDLIIKGSMYINPNDLIGDSLPYYVIQDKKVHHEKKYYLDSNKDIPIENINEFRPNDLNTNIFYFQELIEDSYITVSFNTFGGEEIVPISIMAQGDDELTFKDLNITLPIPQKDGYDFLNWTYLTKYQGSSNFTDTTRFNDDLILEANYVKIKDSYKVDFNPKGATDDFWLSYRYNNLKVDVLRNGYIDEPIYEPFQRGYKFLGWFNNNELFNFNTKVTKDIYLVAMFEEVTSAKVKYITNGGSLDEYTSELPFNIDLELPIPTKSRNAFLGWYLDESFTIKGKSILNRFEVEDHEFTLFAKWQDNSGVLTINTNGGPKMSDIVAEFGQRIVLPNFPPKRDGFLFKGWYLDSQLTKLVPDFFEFEESTTVYVGWERVLEEDLLNEPNNNLLLYISLGALAFGSLLVITKPPKRKR